MNSLILISQGCDPKSSLPDSSFSLNYPLAPLQRLLTGYPNRSHLISPAHPQTTPCKPMTLASLLGLQVVRTFPPA